MSATLETLTIKEILDKSWSDFKANPVINPPFPDPLLADPVVLQPHESPDDKWHLFGHGAFGMYHYDSLDGISWSKRPKFLGWFMVRAYIYHENDTYYLFYEKITTPWKFPFYDSRIEMISSKDLKKWSKPKIIIKPTLPWHKTGNKVGNVCSPSLSKIGNKYVMHYSGGLVIVPECHFPEPKNFGVATSHDISGPYELEPEPLSLKILGEEAFPTSDRSKPYRWTPSFRPFKVKDGYIGLLTMYMRDEKLPESRCDIRFISSKDGFNWDIKTIHRPIIIPIRDWKKSHTYVGYLTRVGNELRIYYNGRNGWFFGREAIGLSTTNV